MRDLHHANKRLYASDEGIRRAVITQWAIGGPVTLVRRRALETVAGWSESLRIDDWDFFLRLAAHDAIGFIDHNVCAYRIHGTNLSRTRDTRTRVHNLMEARDVAIRRSAMFEEPYRTLLLAQSHYIGAKIAFLERRAWSVAVHMGGYALLSLVSRTRSRWPHHLLERA
jgi:GT2 family glycosyltransferase